MPDIHGSLLMLSDRIANRGYVLPLSVPVLEAAAPWNQDLDGGVPLTYSVTLPTGIEATDYILLMFRVQEGDTINEAALPAGYSLLAKRSSLGTTYALGKAAVGGETTAVLTFTTGKRHCGYAYRISGGESTSVQAVFAATNVNDQPAVSFALNDVLVLAVVTSREGDTIATAPPTGYSNLLTTAAGAGSALDTRVSYNSAERTLLTAASEDAGSFAIVDENEPHSLTFVIIPGTA